MSTKILDIIHSPKHEVTLVTHSGRFHSDDVMATAILELFFEEHHFSTKVIRTVTPDKYGYNDDAPYAVVYDIGLGQYDHHQIGEAAAHCTRIDIIDGEPVTKKYSSVGLIWKEIGLYWLDEPYCTKMYSSVIKYIDDADNGFDFNPLSSMIAAQNPLRKEYSDEAFYSTVKKCKEMLYNMIANLKYEKHCREILEAAAIKNAPYLYTDGQFFPGADDVCRENNIPFYIYKNEREPDGYCIKTVKLIEGPYAGEYMRDIPEYVRGWVGVTFLHPSRFLASVNGLERAKKIANILSKPSAL